MYIHSENPDDALTYKSTNLQPVSDMPKAYVDLINLLKYDVMYSEEYEQIHYVLPLKKKGYNFYLFKTTRYCNTENLIISKRGFLKKNKGRNRVGFLPFNI